MSTRKGNNVGIFFCITELEIFPWSLEVLSGCLEKYIPYFDKNTTLWIILLEQDWHPEPHRSVSGPKPDLSCLTKKCIIFYKFVLNEMILLITK
jgi:hypothetical protein